jgi:hypothetical protein
VANPRGGENPYLSPEGHNIVDVRFYEGMKLFGEDTQVGSSSRVTGSSTLGHSMAKHVKQGPPASYAACKHHLHTHGHTLWLGFKHIVCHTSDGAVAVEAGGLRTAGADLLQLAGMLMCRACSTAPCLLHGCHFECLFRKAAGRSLVYGSCGSAGRVAAGTAAAVVCVHSMLCWQHC